jgi:hypothetical protein
MAENGVYGVVAHGRADPTGAADSTTAINRTATDAARDRTGGLLLFEPGIYRVRETIVVTTDCDGSSATLSYTGRDLALQVGAGTSRTLMLRHLLRLPRVEYANKPERGWDARTIGVEIFNANACEIVVPYVTGFEIGLLMYGTGTGNVYNVTNLWELKNNKVNLKLDADSTGWCNQNLFAGGRLWHLPAEGTLVAGTRQILIANTTNGINNNMFVNTSLESLEVAEYMLDIDKGGTNLFDSCRWEDSSGSGRVRWGAGAAENVIRNGSYVKNITQTKVAGQVRNQLISENLTERQGSTGATRDALERRENLSSSNYPVLSVFTAGTMSSAYTPETDYSFALSAFALKSKVKTDTHERVRIESSSGRIYIGPGHVAANAFLDGDGRLLVGGADLCMFVDGEHDIGQAADKRPRNIYATGKLTLGATQILTGTGTPERVATAPVGSLFLRTDGGAGTTLYVKESGAGNTGWVGK